MTKRSHNAKTMPFALASPYPIRVRTTNPGLTDILGLPGPLSARDNGVLRTVPSFAMRNRDAGDLGDLEEVDVSSWDLRADAINPNQGFPSAAFIEFQVGQTVAAVQYQFNGTEFDRVRSAGAASMAADPVIGAQLVTEPGQWTETNIPALNTIATTTHAAGAAGERHICKAILATLSSGATATGIVNVVVRDGATGVGPIIWAGTLESITGHHAHIEMSGLNIIGSAATAMTLEFTGAGSVTSQEVVSLAGITVT